MVSGLRALILVLWVVAFAAPVCAQEITNWPAPASWSPHSVTRGVSTMGAITSPYPFIGVTPCRIVDTRNAAGPFGGPAFSSGETRSYTIPSGPCSDIPNYAGAYSLNFTVVNMQPGDGFLTAWPTGSTKPLVSTLDYVSAEGAIANAAIVPTGFNGAISVYVNVGTNVIIDINGYYAAAQNSPDNTFLGPGAGQSNTTGLSNVGIGPGALQNNQAGNYNTAVGISALSQSTGGNNTAIGSFAFQVLSSGTGNIALGNCAGCVFSSGDRNIYIASGSASSESDTIRIGYFFMASARTFIDGIRGRTTGVSDAVPVLVDSNGQLGTVNSSIRVKKDVEDMGEASSGLLNLRPVSFRYKSQAGARKQFGLIAEEVEEILPDLVVHDASGNAETVLYHEMPAMLLNELQKQQREIQEQQRQIEELQSELSALRAAIDQR